MSERPLSPHLQVYRLPLTAWLSITHRFTGIFLSLGMIVLVVFVMAIAQGAEAFGWVHAFLQSIFGRVFLWLWIFALIYHLCHGFRHLIWDTGQGFDRESLNRIGLYEILACLLLTASVCLLATLKPWN